MTIASCTSMNSRVMAWKGHRLRRMGSGLVKCDVRLKLPEGDISKYAYRKTCAACNNGHECAMYLTAVIDSTC
jgi:hypothetical protein